MKNPHLRAKLAEVLEAVMPHMEPMAPGAVQPIMFQRERVFFSYRHAPQLAEALITVFVDIEFTGKADVFLSFEFSGASSEQLWTFVLIWNKDTLPFIDRSSGVVRSMSTRSEPQKCNVTHTIRNSRKWIWIVWTPVCVLQVRREGEVENRRYWRCMFDIWSFSWFFRRSSSVWTEV